MNVQDLLARRSVRKYADKPVPEAAVRAALEAAMAAPSAMHCDPWRWLVLTKRADLDALADCLPYGQMLRHAPLGFVACGDLTASNRGELSYLLQDVSASIENLLLALHAQGLGGVWLGIHPNAERIAAVASRFALPPTLIPVSAVAAGWPAETPEARTRFDAAKVRFL